MREKILFFLVLSLFFLSFISAVSPFTQQTIIQGYSIKIPVQDTYEVNHTYNFNFHVTNTSNGYPIDNSSTICNFHLDDKYGNKLVQMQIPHEASSDVVNEWDAIVLGANFSYVGHYTGSIQCNSTVVTSLGGIESFGIDTSMTGTELTTPKTITYSALLLILFLIDMMGVYMAFALKLRNERDDDGNIIMINFQKYVKIVVIGLLYGLILLTLNLMNAIAQNVPDISQFAGIIGGLFSIMISLAWPWTIGIIIWIFFAILQDSKFSKEIKRRFGDLERTI